MSIARSPWWRARGPWFARLAPTSSPWRLDWWALLAGGEATMPLPETPAPPGAIVAVGRQRRSGALPSAEAALAWARDALSGAPAGYRIELRAGRARQARFTAASESDLRAAARAIAGWTGGGEGVRVQDPEGAGWRGTHAATAPPRRSPHARADASPLPVGDPETPLTRAQRAVVEHGGCPAVVIAVAGAGKTTTMVARIAERVQRGLTDPATLLVISFSRAAVAAIAAKLTSRQALAAVDVRTFHSLAHRVLRRHAELGGVSPARGPAPEQVVRRVIERAHARARERDPDLADAWRDVDVAAFAAYRGRCLANLALPPDPTLPLAARAQVRVVPEDPDHPAHAALLLDFEDVRRALGWLDHDQVLIAAWAALHRDASLRAAMRERYRAVIVDEAQDVNAAQLALLEHLSEGRDDVMLVGDDDQSIYGFRGSQPGSLRGFAERHRARVLILPDAFRSRAEPLAAATALMSHGLGRWPVRPRAVRGQGGTLTLTVAGDAAAEAAALLERARSAWAAGAAWGEQVVLLRRFAQATALEEAAARAGIPVRVEGAPALVRAPAVIAAWAGVALALGLPETPAARERAWRRWLSGPGGFARAAAWTAARQLAPLALPGAEAWRASGLAAPAGVMDPAARLASVWEGGAAEEHALAAVALLALGDDPMRWPAAPPEALAATARLLAEGVLRGGIAVEGGTPLRTHEPGTCAATPAATLAAAFAAWRAALARSVPADALLLTSVHRAKGLEWRVVHVPGMNAGRFPLGADAEERRLAYVAWTRAREALHLYRDETAPASPFLAEGEVMEIAALTHDLAALAARPADAYTLAGAWALREARGRYGGEGGGYDAGGPSAMRRSPLEATVATHRSRVGASRTGSAS